MWKEADFTGLRMPMATHSLTILKTYLGIAHYAKRNFTSDG